MLDAACIQQQRLLQRQLHRFRKLFRETSFLAGTDLESDSFSARYRQHVMHLHTEERFFCA